MIKFVVAFNKWLNAQNGWFRAVLIPFVLGSLSLLILLFWRDLGAISGGLLLATYFIVLFFSFLVNFENTKFVETIYIERKIASNRTTNVDEFVQEKIRRMSLALSQKDELSNLKLSKKIRSAIELRKTVNTLNRVLFRHLDFYLSERLGSERGNLYLSLLCQNNQCFELLGSPQHSPASKRHTGASDSIKVSDMRAMISQLHADTGLKYSGASDTFKAAEAGKFYFFHPSQKETLKSIFIYKITSELHDLPMGYWCLESDRVGDLPSPANIAEDSSLVEIFSSFSSRIQLEFLYNDALCIADNIFFKGNSNE